MGARVLGLVGVEFRTRTSHYESITVSGTGYNDNARVLGLVGVDEQLARPERERRAAARHLRTHNNHSEPWVS